MFFNQGLYMFVDIQTRVHYGICWLIEGFGKVLRGFKMVLAWQPYSCGGGVRIRVNIVYNGYNPK